MRYSILLPAYNRDGKMTEMIEKCIALIKEHSAGQDYELLTDGEPGGYGRAINRLMLKAKGEYLVFTATDVFIGSSDWLEKLAVPNTITSKHISSFHINGERVPDCSLFCVPKNIQEKIGLFDEQFSDGYGYDDNDYMHRAVLLNIPFLAVQFASEHIGSHTFKTYYTEAKKQEMMQKNRVLFFEKWKLDQNANYPS